jgi:hypothetical protein
MSSKLRFIAILGLAGGLAACTTTGPGASGSVAPTLPIGVVPPPASFIVPPASSSAAPSTGPTASPDASSGPPPTPNAIDPCSLLTQTEASTLIGKNLGAGVSTTLASLRVCTFKSGTTEVKVFLTPPATDAAAADAFYDDARASANGLVIDDIQIPPYARAGYGNGTAQGAPVSGLVVVDGNVGFEVYCGFPACSENASAQAATLIGSRLP